MPENIKHVVFKYSLLPVSRSSIPLEFLAEWKAPLTPENNRTACTLRDRAHAWGDGAKCVFASSLRYVLLRLVLLNETLIRKLLSLVW